MKYKTILYNDDPTKVVNCGQIVLTINDATTDIYGLHYKVDGYKAIFSAMASLV